MVHFSYKGECGIHESMHFKAFKEKKSWLGLQINNF